nr:MAG TPA: hypothetical protein [Caudoviricetes sp.]
MLKKLVKENKDRAVEKMEPANLFLRESYTFYVPRKIRRRK